MPNYFRSMMKQLEQMRESYNEKNWSDLATAFREQRLSLAGRNSAAEKSQADHLEFYLAFCLKEVLKQNTNNIELWWELALIYSFSTTLSDDARAFYCVKKCAELDPTNSSYWYQIYEIAERNNEYTDEQIGFLRKIMSLTRKADNLSIQDLFKITTLAHHLEMNVMVRIPENRPLFSRISNSNSAFGLTPSEILDYHTSQNQPLMFSDYRNNVLSNRPLFEHSYRHAAPAEPMRSILPRP